MQSRDISLYEPENLKTVSKKQPSEQEMADLRFAFTICKHVKSNCIVLAKDEAVVGVGKTADGAGHGGVDRGSKFHGGRPSGLVRGS